MDDKNKKGMALPELKGTKTSIHLIMVLALTLLDILLCVIICVQSWEMWMLPLIAIALIVIWVFHILHSVPDTTFENFCISTMLVEFFFFGVHGGALRDIPLVISIILFIISMLDKRRMLHLSAAIYILVLLYHVIFLHTISVSMTLDEYLQLVFNVIGVMTEIFIARHIIYRRKIESAQMNDMRIKLNMATEQNANFLSNVSHELRTPINMVTGITEVALGRELAPELREDMHSIQLAGIRLADQIRDILDYTEIVGKTLIPVEDRYMVSSILGDIIAVTTVQNKNPNIELVFDIDSSIPSVLVGDGEKLSRVIRLMLDNAIKFTTEGGVCVRISYRKESYGINLIIDIIDTGIGITKSQLSKIYDDFYQVDSGKTRTVGGLGLGISIAHGLLQVMGGFISIKSDKGQGTQVHISVPQKIADERPSMAIMNPELFCVVCYFKSDKYTRREIQEFYDNTIYRLVANLEIDGYLVYYFE